MTTALILGSALCLWDDVARASALAPFDHVIAVKRAGVLWPGRLDAWVSLHPDRWAADLAERERMGHPPALRLVSHQAAPALGVVAAEYKFAGQRRSASSGVFGLKYALVDLGIDRAVLCGIPLDRAAGKLGSGSDWPGAQGFRQGFEEALPFLEHRVRSMSGWTRTLLGEPTVQWLSGGMDADADVLTEGGYPQSVKTGTDVPAPQERVP